MTTGFVAEPGDERLTSAILSDALDAVGRRHQVLSPAIRPVVPGMRVFGRAATVQFAPTTLDSENPYDEAIDFIDELQAGSVAVVATGNSSRSAFWGELFSAAAIGRGASGVITDGCLRDTPKIADLGFPAFTRGNRPIDYRARMRVVAQAEPVILDGVTVQPGDLLLADDDGIVVIPQGAEHEVLERARARAVAERRVLHELLAGDGLRAVWRRHGIL
ncbi:RraA family protein [Luteipulveratus mongoliensis]|uniref:Putative 4-hydroxy-4-methyl-2-oxoglutarate aldolase n=1 Tax=Luteipulveratus mongoliensis TaxID=571913 RepID=A0A0K1JL63_9MICO|nr:RraA family protein [Luteipulveratus mongoliensis]AKU17313.1 dimethylmenaquinone methyltransferase [Luteipulveratus mongoliensis]